MAVAPANAPAPTGQQGEGQGTFDKLKQEWMGFFAKPEVQVGLLQFGSSLLAPGANIGLALSDAAQAAAGTRQAATERDLAAQEAARRGRTVDLTEREIEQRGQSLQLQRESQSEERRQFDRSASQRDRQLDISERLANRPRATTGAGGAKSIPGLSYKTFYDMAMEEETILAETEGREPDFALVSELAADRYAQAYATAQSRLAGGGATAPAEGAPVVAGEGTSAEAPTQANQPPPTPEGYPHINTISDEQWTAIAADPELLAEARKAYGAGNVALKIAETKARTQPQE